MTSPSYAAIVLAGGRGSRMGGADKAALTDGARTLLEIVLDAVAGAAVTVVVGPPGLADRAPGRDYLVVREDPPFSGPAAAIAAGVRTLGVAALVDSTDEIAAVVVLAVDLPRAGEVVPALLAAWADAGYPAGSAFAAADASGRPQLLTALYPTALLRAAVEQAPDLADASVRRLLGCVPVVGVQVPSGSTDDVDTLADASRAGLTGAGRAAMSDSGDQARTADGDRDDVLRAWWRRLCDELGIAEVPVDIDAILGLAGTAAHSVVRPAAPITTFLVGYAAGLSGGGADALRAAIARATDAATDRA